MNIKHLAIVCAVVLSFGAVLSPTAPALAYVVPVTEDPDCEGKSPYKKITPYVRTKGKGETLTWLRCGTKRWGYEHIVFRHSWGTFVSYATEKTFSKGTKLKQGGGSYRYKHSFNLMGEHYDWIVVVQHTKTYSDEPRAKGVITSFQKDTIGPG